MSSFYTNVAEGPIEAVNQVLGEDTIKYGESSSRDTHGMAFSDKWVEPVFLTDKTKEVYKKYRETLSIRVKILKADFTRGCFRRVLNGKTDTGHSI